MPKKEKEKVEKAFNNFRHNGIHFWFPNGNGISTIWGYGSYSDNYNFEPKDKKNVMARFETFLDSNSVEVMILKCSQKLLKRLEKKYNEGYKQPFTSLTITEWLDIVNEVSKK